MLFLLNSYAFEDVIAIWRQISSSVWEVEEVVGRIVVSAHTDAPNSVGEEAWQPEDTDVSAVHCVHEVTLEDVLSEPTIHVMEVEISIDIRSRMDNGTLASETFTLS